jgi:hypothetical protein
MDENVYKALSVHSIPSIYLRAQRLGETKDVPRTARAVALLVQATYFLAFASREAVETRISNAKCKPEKLVLRGSSYVGKEDCALPSTTLEGDMGKIEFCPG